jgi:hypothetical protein
MSKNNTREVRLEAYITEELKNLLNKRKEDLLKDQGISISVSSLVSSILSKELMK